MNQSEKDLLIEVHVTVPGRRGTNFTGYPVAPGRILTARHGLLPKEPAAGKTIEVRWHLQTGAARKWRKAKIEWQDAELDAAVLSCRPPPGMEGFGRVSDQAPHDHMPWSGAGIARAGDKDAETSGSFAFKGGAYCAGSHETRFDIGVDDECEHPEWYEGASGMPIFVDHRILGIAVSTGGPAGARRFKASPTRLMLADPKFCRAIGRAQGEDRQQAAAGRIAALLDQAHCQGLRTQLGNRLAGGPQEPKALAAALLGADLEQALDALHAAFGAVGAGPDDQVRDALAEVLGEMLPVSYEPADVDGTAQRHRDPQVFCLELPAGLATAGEIIMAGVRARPVYFDPLPDRESYPRPRDQLPVPPESGFDSDGSDYRDNIEADLRNKLAAGNGAAFESYLGRRFAPEEERRVRPGSDEDRADMRSIVADALAYQARVHRRYFYVLFDPEIDPLHDEAVPTLKTLKGHYDLLDFAVLAQANDLKVRRRERQRLALLRALLPCKQEKR